MALVDYSAGVIPGTTGQLDPGTSGGAGSAGWSLGLGTGQLGSQPVEGASMGSNPFVVLWDWLNKPLTNPLSLFGIFTLIAYVGLAFLAWNLLLYHIRIAAEAI